MIIEAVGLPATQAQAVAAAKKGAQVLMFGVGPQEAHFEMNTYDIYKKQLTIQGSFINPLTFKDAISLLESGKMNVAPLISTNWDSKKSRTSSTARSRASPRPSSRSASSFGTLPAPLPEGSWRRSRLRGGIRRRVLPPSGAAHHLPPVEGRGFVSRFSPQYSLAAGFPFFFRRPHFPCTTSTDNDVDGVNP